MRLFCCVLLAAVTALLGAGCSSGSPVPVSYYLSLGDSLAVGVQPDANGASVPTGDGYADQLYATLRPSHPGLRLVKLGCLGETTSSMISGGKCRYREGSQLAAALAFLRAHQGHVFLVTLDIGANDPEHCLSLATAGSLGSALSCIQSVFSGSSGNLTTIVSRLHAAAGSGTKMIGMNYYLPALGEWRSGMLGQEVARLIAQLTSSYNKQLESVYGQYSVPVADVFGAFATLDFGNPRPVAGLGVLPHNVALICQLTWECTPPPRGPNQHANRAGYAVIASAFARAGSV